MRSVMRPATSQRGYTYIGLLLLVTLLTTLLAAAGVLWRTEVQREREADLLFIGKQYVRAITLYYENTPAGQQPRFPMRLEDLLEDKRWPTVRRHLRRLYADPMTNQMRWGIVPAPDGGIFGVYSLSQGVPIKRDRFGPPPYDDFAGAATYQNWRFIYIPTGGSTGN